MELPTTKSKITTNFSDLITLVYGEGKIGKSTFCSGAENALFLSTEPTLKHLKVLKIDIRSWADLLQACSKLMATENPFKTIIIDTIENAQMMCRDHILAKYGVDHETDLNGTKGYSLVNREFNRVINKLAFMNYGLIFVSHTKSVKINTRTGSHNKIIPNLPSNAGNFIAGLVDIIIYCDVEKHTDQKGNISYTRVIRLDKTDLYLAGGRTRNLKDTMPLDYGIFKREYEKNAKLKNAQNENIR